MNSAVETTELTRPTASPRVSTHAHRDEAPSVWIDGQLVPSSSARVSLLSQGVQYGAAVFEGIRCYDAIGGPALFRGRDHFRRFKASASMYLMRLPYSGDDLVHATADVVSDAAYQSCYVRPFAWYGDENRGLSLVGSSVHVAIACWPWGPYLGKASLESGVRAKVSSFRRVSTAAIPPSAKASGQYLNSILAKAEATAAGYDEAILLNDYGHVTDGSGENVFVVRDDTLVTPPRAAGILAGITRDTVLTIATDLGLGVREENLTRADLYAADEAFFSGTAAEIVPIREVDDREIGDGGAGRTTRHIQEEFAAIVAGRSPRSADWLDVLPSAV